MSVWLESIFLNLMHIAFVELVFTLPEEKKMKCDEVASGQWSNLILVSILGDPLPIFPAAISRGTEHLYFQYLSYYANHPTDEVSDGQIDQFLRFIWVRVIDRVMDHAIVPRKSQNFRQHGLDGFLQLRSIWCRWHDGCVQKGEWLFVTDLHRIMVSDSNSSVCLAYILRAFDASTIWYRSSVFCWNPHLLSPWFLLRLPPARGFLRSLTSFKWDLISN